jgi:hypothetical protein
MIYETGTLINKANPVFSLGDSSTQSLESRLQAAESKLKKLTEFMIRAEPYIKAMELIDPPENKTS